MSDKCNGSFHKFLFVKGLLLSEAFLKILFFCKSDADALQMRHTPIKKELPALAVPLKILALKPDIVPEFYYL
ncbi:hypothetical protein PKOR_21650 [Pontibacter korlensis]|uniref:Uncharacterized protein n=1 Tax=Pontibacter korlensis TaxID=400092 RepID=A0A0E3ZGX9_9BACT|nr:hypothetical protein PKOR_21650 [Pontibacter korlensis]